MPKSRPEMLFLTLILAIVADLFEDGWKHPEKTRAKIKRIFVVNLPDHLNESYQEYK